MPTSRVEAVEPRLIVGRGLVEMRRQGVFEAQAVGGGLERRSCRAAVCRRNRSADPECRRCAGSGPCPPAAPPSSAMSRTAPAGRLRTASRGHRHRQRARRLAWHQTVRTAACRRPRSRPTFAAPRAVSRPRFMKTRPCGSLTMNPPLTKGLMPTDVSSAVTRTKRLAFAS